MKQGSGGTFFRFTVGRPSVSGRHVAYITRERAVLDREAGVLFHNLPAHVESSRSYTELRANLVAYASMREEIELARHRSHGQPRTHYRALMSFERAVSTEKALAMTKEWLERELPTARGVAVVHRDTEHVHVHVWLDARRIDDRKIRLDRKQYIHLDESWNRTYSREMDRDPSEHERRKQANRLNRELGTERTAAENERCFQRREIGVYASRHPSADRTGQNFLEQVRGMAGADLREARSWAELERRLQRHGLRFEARGAGMVITNGRQEVKASAVERSASRQRLEQRFGSTLREHLRQAPERPRLPPGADRVRRDLDRLERLDWLRKDLASAARDRDAAQARLDAMTWAETRANAADRALARGLDDLYRDPRAARGALEALKRRSTPARVAAMVRSAPEQLGQLRSTGSRIPLFEGLRGHHPQLQARITRVVELIREAEELRMERPTALARAFAERDLRAAEHRVRRLEERIAREPGRERLLVRIGARSLTLDRSAGDGLSRGLDERRRILAGDAQRFLTRAVERGSLRAAPAPLREVVGWMASPKRSIPRGVARALRHAVRDDQRERGLR